jgi:hypothetical protein
MLGTKTGKRPLCKETKTLLLLRYGISLCEECLAICVGVEEQLEMEKLEK